MIPDDKVNEIRDRAGILEIVSDYVPLRKSGANYQGLCPFHGEKTPSFNVNPGRGIFHCFGCGAGGNVISFIMKIEGLSFPDSVRFLAKRVGVEIEERQLSPAEARQRNEKEQLYEINALAAAYYRKVLLEDPAAGKARDYLANRGVTTETSEAYHLGYAPAGWDQLARYLERKRVPLELAEKLGIIRKGQRGGYQDLFRNRLLFVISDSNGRVTGFGGRVLDDSLPKYINSPESPIYRKSDILFGVDLAKSAMREAGAAIIVEGYFDHLGLYQAGVRNVAATCGTALTPGHVKLLNRYAERCYILFDADSAGKKATFRAMELSFQENLPTRVILLPEGEDPDSFVQRYGAEAFAKCLEKSMPVFEYYLGDVMRSAGQQGLDGKIKVAGEIARMLAKVTNPIERELYEREAAKRLDIDRAVLKQGGAAPPSQRQTAPQPTVSPRNAGPEEMLFSLMARFPEVLKRVADQGAERFFGPALLPAATAALSNQPTDPALLLECIEDSEVRGRVASLLIDEGRLDDIDPEKAFDQCRAALAKVELKDMKALVRQLAALDPESSEYSELLQKIDHLRNRKSQLS